MAIHDVAPATWPECLRLLRAIRAVADIPLTWLVVPRYHGSSARSRACENMLAQLLADGHEVALHGYTHLDTAPLGRSPGERFLRTVYARREGEFAAVGEDDARRRIELGLALFRERQWDTQGAVAGFVAPAWLLGEPAWQALRAYGFVYTTSWSHFYLLTARRALFSPALVYAARNRAGRLVSPPLASATAALLDGAPLVRLALHPRDAHYPALVRHAQGLVEQLLRARQPLTKAAFARSLAGQPTSMAPSTVPSDRPTTSVPFHSPRSSEGRSARHPPWR